MAVQRGWAGLGGDEAGQEAKRDGPRSETQAWAG